MWFGLRLFRWFDGVDGCLRFSFVQVNSVVVGVSLFYCCLVD